MTNILALDLATTTGWALRLDGQITHSYDSFPRDPEEPRGARWVRFNAWLDAMVLVDGRPRVDLLVYEKAIAMPSRKAGSGPAAIEIALGFTTRVDELAARHGLEAAPVYHSTLKKWTTGDGRAKKPAMMAAVERRFRIRVDDDNEADAIALLFYAEAELIWSPPRPPLPR